LRVPALPAATGTATGHRAAAPGDPEICRRRPDEPGRAPGNRLCTDDVPAWQGNGQPLRRAEDPAAQRSVRLGQAPDDVVGHLRVGRSDAGLQLATDGAVAGDLEPFRRDVHRPLLRTLPGVGVRRAIPRLLSAHAAPVSPASRYTAVHR